jgi:hypothetical protein
MRRKAPHGVRMSLTAPPGYTYPATYKVCTGPARGGRPNPHTGLHRRAPHRCRAAPDPRGFLTAIGSRSFPIGRPFDQIPRVGRTGLDTRPSRQRWGDYWLSKGRRFASLRVRRRISPPCRSGNHARDLRSRPPLLPRPLGHHTPLCGRTAGPPGTGLERSSLEGGHWLPMGRGREVGRFLLYGPNPYRDWHPHVLGL